MPATSWESTLAEGNRDMRILLVDDVEATRELLASTFRQEHHDIDVACNGVEAVELFARRHYDIVLTDIQMPILDGINAARKMRELEADDESRERTPILALTAGAKGASHEECLAAGIDRRLMKPIDLPLLCQEIEEMVNNPSNSQENAAAGAEQIPAATTFDLEKALGRLRNDRSIFCRLVQFFIDDHGELLKQLGVALEAGDTAAVQRHAHSLKGMASSFSADQVVATALELETLAKNGQLNGAEKVYGALRQQVDALLEELGPYCSEDE